MDNNQNQIHAGADVMTIGRNNLLVSGIIALATLLLYGPFLHNPILFDDLYFFAPGVPERVIEALSLKPRHLAYATLALSWKWLGPELVAFRVVSLFLHILVAMGIYFFVRQVQAVLSKQSTTSISLPALLAALVFALHPVAVYGAAYLIQRTIVLATLFSLISWAMFLCGLRSNKRSWLWGSVAMYVLAVLGKEHAVMTPAVTAILVIWWWRTEEQREPALALTRRLLPMFVVQGSISLLTILHMRGVIGVVYELTAPEMLESISVQNAWLLSAATQCWLFFKYLFLWIVPNPLWMSADMREPFASALFSMPEFLGGLAFCLWPLMAIYFLWRGGRVGLLGFALLAPWVLFATELTTVRIQEVFVLYRSYLWIVPALSVFVLLDHLRGRMLLALTIVVPLFLFPLALNRLTTFSHPFFLWDDAARLLHERTDVAGAERIYRNRGGEWQAVKKIDAAIADYSKAIAANPKYSYAYNDRGAALLELRRYEEALYDFDTAIGLRPDYPNSHMGRAKALEALGNIEKAKASYVEACRLNWQFACQKLQTLR